MGANYFWSHRCFPWDDGHCPAYETAARKTSLDVCPHDAISGSLRGDGVGVLGGQFPFPSFLLALALAHSVRNVWDCNLANILRQEVQKRKLWNRSMT